MIKCEARLNVKDTARAAQEKIKLSSTTEEGEIKLSLLCVSVALILGTLKLYLEGISLVFSIKLSKDKCK